MVMSLVTLAARLQGQYTVVLAVSCSQSFRNNYLAKL